MYLDIETSIVHSKKEREIQSRNIQHKVYEAITVVRTGYSSAKEGFERQNLKEK